MSIKAQDDGYKKFDKSYLYGGGNIGATFGDYTSVEISPIVGYWLTSKITVGLGATYQYYANSYSDFSMNIYGGNIFAEVYPIKQLFLHAELGGLNYNINYLYPYKKADRQWIAYPLVGGGVRLSIGNNAFFTVALLWNLNDDQYSIYTNPIYRIGFVIGI